MNDSCIKKSRLPNFVFIYTAQNQLSTSSINDCSKNNSIEKKSGVKFPVDHREHLSKPQNYAEDGAPVPTRLEVVDNEWMTDWTTTAVDQRMR